MDGKMRQDTSHASRTALQNALKRIDYLRTSISTPDSGYNLLVLRSCALTESGARRAAVTPWLRIGGGRGAGFASNPRECRARGRPQRGVQRLWTARTTRDHSRWL